MNDPSPRSSVAPFVLFLLAVFAPIAMANPVAIQDASFDNRGLSSGSWNTTLTPWQETGGTANGGGYVQRLSGFAADGQNHLGMNLNHNVWQDLGVTYQANMRYTLSVAVGNRSSTYTTTSNQSRYLLAASDGTVFATGTLNASTIPVGTFADAPALVFVTTSRSPANGKTIRVLLEARGSGRSHFDKIRLTAVSTLSPQTITFAPLEPVVVGDPPLTLTASASSGLAVSYTSSNPALASVSGNLLTAHADGTVTITANQAGNASFLPAEPVSRTLIVHRADRDPQTIDFPQPLTQTLGNRPATLAASASSGLPVSYASSNPEVAEVTGNTVTFTGAGSTVITASQAGDEDHLPAAPVQQTLAVNTSAGGLTIQPSSLALNVRSGETSNVSFILNNPTSGQIDWKFVTEDETGSSHSLEEQLEAVKQSGTLLNGPLPARYDFPGGGGGGGVDNLDGLSVQLTKGNRLQTNLGGPLVYTNDHVASSPALGPDGRYFTHKLPGLFVFAAETDGIEWFEIDGTVWNDDDRSAESFHLTHGGRVWTGFTVRRRISSWSAMTQVILIDQTAGLQMIQGETKSQQQRITGLSGKRRIYQFLSYANITWQTDLSAFLQFPIYRDLASRYLGLVPDFSLRGRWHPDAGTILPGEEMSVEFRFDSAHMPAGVYTGNLRAWNGLGDASLDSVPIKIEVGEPVIDAPEFVEFTAFSEMDTQTIPIPLGYPNEGSVAWTAEVENGSPPWLDLLNSVGQAPDVPVVTLNPGVLPPGIHAVVLRLSVGDSLFRIPFIVRKTDPNIVRLVADPQRPVVYALHHGEAGAGHLLMIDQITRRIVRAVEVGKFPGDLDITEDGGGLWVIHSGEASIIEFTLPEMKRSRSHILPNFEAGKLDPRSLGARIRCGSGSMIYYLDVRSSPPVGVYDTESGELVQFIMANGQSAFQVSLVTNGFGDIALSPDRKKLFGWRRSGTFSGGTFQHAIYLVSFGITDDGTLHEYVRGPEANIEGFRRNPLDTPLLVRNDGTDLFLKNHVIDSKDFGRFPKVFPDPVYSMVPDGLVASSLNAIHDGRTGGLLHEHGADTRVQTILPDYSHLVWFDGQAGALQWLDLPDTLGAEALALHPAPSDGSVVFSAKQLRWTPTPGIRRYKVYFSTDPDAVENMDPSAFLAEISDRYLSLKESLETGRTYYWSVVPVAGGAPSGEVPVQSFSISSATISQESIHAQSVAGATRTDDRLEIEAGGPLSWTATASVPWISFANSSGITPSTLQIRYDARDLAPGLHSGEISLSIAGVPLSVPVALRAHPLNVTQMRAHAARAALYGVSNTPTSVGESFFIEINPSDSVITRAITVGMNPTDFTIDTNGERAYVASFGHDGTPVVDLASWQRLPDLDLGDQVHGIEADVKGRLFVQGMGTGPLRIIDAASGELLGGAASGNISRGFGRVDPEGDTLYVLPTASNSLGVSTLAKYDVRTNKALSVKTLTNIRSGRVRLSGDGRFLGVKRGDRNARSWLIDEDFNTIQQLALDYLSGSNSIVALSHHADLAVLRDTVVWGKSAERIVSLPFVSEIAAFSADDAYLVRFDPVDGKLHSLNVASAITRLPGPWPRPGQILSEAPDHLSWTPVEGARSYSVGLSNGSESWSFDIAGGETTEVGLPVLPAGWFYEWSVTANLSEGEEVHGPFRFGIEIEEGPAVPNQFGFPLFSDHEILVSGTTTGGGLVNIYDFDPMDGATNERATLNEPANMVATGYRRIYALNRNAGEGKTVVPLELQDDGNWRALPGLPAPGTVVPSGYGATIASCGGILMVGAPGAWDERGRVYVYLEQPALAQIQVLHANDAVNADGFGDRFSLDGDTLAVVATGSGRRTPGTSPAVYIFTRSPATGIWSQNQKIVIQDSDWQSNLGQIVLSGDFLAVAGSSSIHGPRSVYVFGRGADGKWHQEAAIDRLSVASAGLEPVSSMFATTLALDDDTLFIGDPFLNFSSPLGGWVNVFRRIDGEWIQAPMFKRNTNSSAGFGAAFATRDGWLFASGGGPNWLFRIRPDSNQRPYFTSPVVFQAVRGRYFEAEVVANDPDGDAGLTMVGRRLPQWMGIEDHGDGRATLSGTPNVGAPAMFDLEIAARDPAGAEARRIVRFSVLEPGNLPEIVQTPAGGVFTAGTEISFSVVAGQQGPFTYQWQLDGRDIPGANRRELHLGNATAQNAGTYRVVVKNEAGETVSEGAVVEVAPAGLDGGPWTTFGASPSHTGHHPAALDSHWFLPAWEQAVQPGLGLNRAVADRERVVVVPFSDRKPGEVKALDLATGEILWATPFIPASSTNPPSLHGGRIYYQRNNGSDAQLICLNLESGNEVWKSPFNAQWARYEAPAVNESGIYINGGSHGGIYGFNFDGTQRFFLNLAQYDHWTPTLANNRLFSWVGGPFGRYGEGSFSQHDPANGGILWNLQIDWNSLSGSMQTVSSVSGDSAILSNTTEMVCVDLHSRTIRWRIPLAIVGSPAIAYGRAFAIQGDRVVSYSLSDGDPGKTYQTNAAITFSRRLIEQPVIFNDRLAISDQFKTWIFELESARLLQVIDVGGRLSYSNGRLLVAGGDGTLRAFLATPHGRVAMRGSDGGNLEDDGAPLRVGAPPIGGSSVTILTLTNTGLADLGAMSWSLEGDHAADFAVTNTPPAMLDPGAKTTVEITHSPSAKGRREAVLVLSSDDHSQPEFRVPLFALPPHVEAYAAEDITGVSATLHGHVSPNDNDVTIVFEYGLTSEFGTTVEGSPSMLAGEDDDSPVSASIGGLPPGTLHHYRVGAANAHGIHWGEGMTFTTLSDNARLAGITNRLSNRRPAFHPETFDYIASVDFDQSELEMRPVTEHPGASVTINGITVPRGSFSPPLPLAVGTNTLTVVVTAEDGITTLTYTTVVTRLPEFFDLAIDGAPVTSNGFSAKWRNAPLRLNFHPPLGTSLMVVDNTALGFIQDEFENLRHGEQITLSYGGANYAFVANYYGGTGNDLVLQWAGTRVAAWGLNNYGQLGDGGNTQRLSPITVDDSGLLADKTIFALATGYLHSVALCSDGKLVSWGYNVQGQLGNNALANSSAPVPVDTSGVLSDKVVVAIASGSYHNLALCSDGSVAAWGFNNHGQLGDGTKTTARTPVLVNTQGVLAGKQVVAIAAGAYQSYALCSDGMIAAWGYNDEGELGNGGNTSSLVPVTVDVSGALAGRKVAAIAAGQYHALALCTDGTVVSWGYNQRGQLGNSSTTDSASPVEISSFGALSGKTVKAISAGASHSIALCTDGTLAAWGYNSQHQLGVEGIDQSTTPIAVTQPDRPLAELAAGAHHNLGRFTDGGMAAWGGNSSGQLGSNNTQASATPVNVDTSALDHGGYIMFAASGCASSHNLAVFAVPVDVPAGLVGPSGLEAWRLENFADIGVGDPRAADSADFDGDGIPNLVEYAFGLDPRAHCGGVLPAPHRNGDRLEVCFSRTLTAADINYGAEWSPDLQPGSWSDVPDTGNGEEHLFSMPMNTAPSMFMRLRVRSNMPQ